MHTQKLLLNIPDNLVEQIDHYKDIAKEPSRSKTIIDLLKYALTLPPYFKDFDWQKAGKAYCFETGTGNDVPYKSLYSLL